jgi:hypothetical protein
LGHIDGIQLNAEPSLVSSSYWMVTIIPGASFGHEKFTLQAALRDQGIDSQTFFSRLTTLGAYKDHPQSSQPKHTDLAQAGTP